MDCVLHRRHVRNLMAGEGGGGGGGEGDRDGEGEDNDNIMLLGGFDHAQIQL